MLDANAFDYLLDERVDPRALCAVADVYITDVQHGELLAVPDARRRRRLIGVLSQIDPTVRPADAPVPDAASTARGSSLRDLKDRAIAAAARRERCTVVTDDVAFRQALLADGATGLSCADAFGMLTRLPGPARPTSSPSGRPVGRRGTGRSRGRARVRRDG